MKSQVDLYKLPKDVIVKLFLTLQDDIQEENKAYLDKLIQNVNVHLGCDIIMKCELDDCSRYNLSDTTLDGNLNTDVIHCVGCNSYYCWEHKNRHHVKSKLIGSFFVCEDCYGKTYYEDCGGCRLCDF